MRTFEREESIIRRGIPDALHDALCREVERAYIAGGALTSIFRGARIKDYDLFFHNIAQALTISDWMEKEGGYEKVYHSDAADTFKVDGKTFQVIHAKYGGPQEIIDGFDFTVTQAAYVFSTKEWFMNDGFLPDLAQRRLVYVKGREYPISTLVRVARYLKKGFTISGIEMLKIALSIQKLKIETFGELLVQLMGIDVMLLAGFIKELKEISDKPYDSELFLHLLEKYLETLYLGESDD